jgi:hypothetical protein
MPDRHRTRAKQRADEIDISPTTLLAQIKTLTAERDAAVATGDEYLGALQRERTKDEIELTAEGLPPRASCKLLVDGVQVSEFTTTNKGHVDLKLSRRR